MKFGTSYPLNNLSNEKEVFKAGWCTYFGDDFEVVSLKLYIVYDY